MSDYRLGFTPEEEPFAAIKVVGVGGGGCNAVDRMIENGVQGIDFISVNTDRQALIRSKAPTRIQVGEKITKGLGCGADPSVGEKAAEESKEEIAQAIRATDMLFITAGMGGGTGTGAAPVVAEIAREMGILTVAVVTRPFMFEGPRRIQNAERGIREIEKYVDSLIVVANDKLLQITEEDTPIDEAFNVADQVLKYGVAGISDLVAIPGLINLDLADVRRVMTNAGVCHMGIGRASGEGRATNAVKQAINSPLLDTTIDGARGVIINFTGGKSMKLHEIDLAASVVRDAVSSDADIIVGAVIDASLEDEIMITVIASGFDQPDQSTIGRGSSVLTRKPTPATEASAPARKPTMVSPIPQPEERPKVNPVAEKPSLPTFLFDDEDEDMKNADHDGTIPYIPSSQQGGGMFGNRNNSMGAVPPFNPSYGQQPMTSDPFAPHNNNRIQPNVSPARPSQGVPSRGNPPPPPQQRPPKGSGKKSIRPWFLADNDDDMEE